MIVIRHTHATGTLIEGSRKGDGVFEIARQHGFRWFPSIQAIGLPGSRDRLARRDRIYALAEALRAAGHEVQVHIDDTSRPRAQVVADQAARLADRKRALEAKAARQLAEAKAHDKRARQIADLIPVGQPILVGHHSQRRAERDQERIIRHTAKAAAGYRQAAETARRAAAVGQDAAYSANPHITAQRIKRVEAELRKIARQLDQAVGEWRERLLVRQAQLEDQLAYDRAQLEAAKAEGRYVEYGPHNVQVGDQVHHGICWLQVVKVNRTTVTVRYDGLTYKIPFTKIRRHRAGQTGGDAA